MKKFCLLCCIVLFCATVFSGCDAWRGVDNGTYISKTPYIKYISDSNALYNITQEIEIDRKVYKAIAMTSQVGVITYYEYQEEDVKPINGLVLDDNEIYAVFSFKVDRKNNQLILTDDNNGNVYHLDRVGEAQTGEGLWLNDWKLLYIVQWN